ncbi:MAG: protein-disulfide reductase DsbD domain-containing protein [Myxococcota bacterium]|nr:protein-disulfide reductase DsbD domain-containing protein [Myxococcota bacterium]
MGKITLDDDSIRVERGDPEIKITAAIRGGKGSIRQGVIRHLVVRFELADGLHIYGEPVPEGMVATQINVEGPPGLAVMEPILPPTRKLQVAGANLEVWSGTVDLVVPFYAKGELASETRPLDMSEAPIEIEIRYQACTDEECLLPKTETLSFSLPLDVIDVPALSLHMGHGQREGSYSSVPAMLRLIFRKIRAYPPGFFKYVLKVMKLNRQARKRAQQERGG